MFVSVEKMTQHKHVSILVFVGENKFLLNFLYAPLDYNANMIPLLYLGKKYNGTWFHCTCIQKNHNSIIIRGGAKIE